MLETLIISAKRLGLLIPGLFVAYLASKQLYPLFNQELPAVIATLLTYIAGAYVIIPAIIRLGRVFIRPKHLPLYCTTPDGFASDPINIAIIGTINELRSSMQAAGWHEADKRTIKTVFKLGVSILLRRAYQTAPFSNLYLFGRRQDIGFELPAENNPSERHHVRFWGLVELDDHKYREHARFWRRHHISPVEGQLLWLGAASKDIGLGVIRHNAQLTHMIHHDTNAERELIIKHLRRAKRLKQVRTQTVSQPMRLTNRVVNGWLQSDGVLKICELKD